MKRIIALLALVVFVSGCATAPFVSLNSGAGEVRVENSVPPDNYQQIGPISGYDGEGCGAFGYCGGYDRALIDLKNRANTAGVDYVQIITIEKPHATFGCFVNTYQINGIGYRKVRNLPSPTPILNQSEENNPTVEKMRLLKQLCDEGLITEKQFEEKQQELLK